MWSPARRRPIRLVALALTVAALFVATACSRPSSEPARSGEPVFDQLVDHLPFALTEPPETLRLALVRPPSFRPEEVVLSDQAAVIVADLLYDGLTEAVGTTGSLRPGLAERWEPDPTYRRWTFWLDPQTGVDAATVASSLGSLASEPTSVPGRQGSEGPPDRPMVALTAGLRSVTATDDSTVVIELDRPDAGLPWILSGLPYSIVGPGGAPTGAYEIERDGEATLELRRSGGRPGSGSATIEVRWVDEPSTGRELLLDGHVDGAVVDPGSLDALEQETGRAIPPTLAVRYYVLNADADQLASHESRAGLLGLIDQGSLLEAAGRDDLVAIEGLVPAEAAGAAPLACGVRCRAVGLASENGPPLTDGPVLVASNGSDQVVIGRALVDELVGQGVDADLDPVTAGELAAAIVDGSTDLFAFGWVAPAGSVDAVLPPLLRQDSPANVARITSAELQDLLAVAATTADDRERWALLDRAHQLAIDEMKVLPVAVSAGTLVVAPELDGVTIRADGSIDLEASG